MKSALLSTFVASAAACGGFFCAPQQPVVQSGEAIIFGVKGRSVSMHIQINYEGPAEDFSWLLPVMFEPTLTTSSETFFQSMFSQTLPQFNFRIDEERPGTCSTAPSQTNVRCGAPGGSSTAAKGVDVKEGSVGPFDYKIIKAVDRNVTAIRTWLADNGYDEYAGSVPIIDHYVQSDHYFVALRLKKDTDSGDLVPIAIEYEMTEDMETIACVPLILTRVAATKTMPILVHILGEHRADPVNYFRVELDEQKVDWVGCQRNEGCYDRDCRARAGTAFRIANDHAFVEEYAGPTDVLQDQIRFDIDASSLSQSASVLDFLSILEAANVPSHRLLDSILKEYIPHVFSDQAPSFCSTMSSVYNPLNTFRMERCASLLVEQDYDFAGLAAEVKERVLDPADEAQTFADSFPYWTRLWVNMRQEKMVKDPFFRFRENSSLPDRSNVHSAVGVPLCSSGQDEQTEMEITVADGSTTRVPVRFDRCLGWRRTNSDPLFGELDSPALQFEVPGFGTEEDRFLLRKEDGTFDLKAIENSFVLMDARVMDQTIEGLSLPTGTPTASPTASPISESSPNNISVQPLQDVSAAASLVYSKTALVFLLSSLLFA